MGEEKQNNEKKRQRESENLPNCIKGNAPPENHKRRMIEKFSIESNVEDDERRIEQRMKQIKFGKNTIGYDRYIAAVPKDQRKGYAEHPRTPDPYEKVPKRTFDGRVKAWRRQLHKWDVDLDSSLSISVPTSRIETSENKTTEICAEVHPNIAETEESRYDVEDDEEDDVL